MYEQQNDVKIYEGSSNIISDIMLNGLKNKD